MYFLICDEGWIKVLYADFSICLLKQVFIKGDFKSEIYEENDAGGLGIAGKCNGFDGM